MRRSREDTAKTREDIVEAASRLFRKKGIGGVSVADVMGEVGLTVGGFYRHFDSKDALVAEAISAASKGTVKESASMAELADAYLSEAHRAHAEAGCPVAGLCSEIGRERGAPRRAFTEAVERMIASIATVRTGRRRQLQALACSVGALVLARAVDDRELSDEILAAGRASLKVSS